MQQKGFTLIELLISIALMIMISRMAYISFSSFNNRQILDKEVDQVKSYIQKARVDSLNSKDGDSHGLVFGSSTVSVIELSATSTQFEFVLNNRVRLTGSTLGTSTISFARISGMPSTSGTLTYTYSVGGKIVGTSTITINGVGVVQ